MLLELVLLLLQVTRGLALLDQAFEQFEFLEGVPLVLLIPEVILGLGGLVFLEQARHIPVNLPLVLLAIYGLLVQPRQLRVLDLLEYVALSEGVPPRRRGGLALFKYLRLAYKYFIRWTIQFN